MRLYNSGIPIRKNNRTVVETQNLASHPLDYLFKRKTTVRRDAKSCVSPIGLPIQEKKHCAERRKILRLYNSGIPIRKNNRTVVETQNLASHPLDYLFKRKNTVRRDAKFCVSTTAAYPFGRITASGRDAKSCVSPIGLPMQKLPKPHSFYRLFAT